jgi:predicted small secreted protein
MKKLLAVISLTVTALTLAGCSPNTETGVTSDAPGGTTDYFSDTVDIYFTDGQKLNCLINHPGYEDSTLACNWRGIEGVGELEIANESDYIIRYIDYNGESTPCIFGDLGYSTATASCAFGLKTYDTK